MVGEKKTQKENLSTLILQTVKPATFQSSLQPLLSEKLEDLKIIMGIIYLNFKDTSSRYSKTQSNQMKHRKANIEILASSFHRLIN